VEESLAKALLSIKESTGKIILKTESDHGGKFSFDVPLGEIYTITYSKPGDGTSRFEIFLD